MTIVKMPGSTLAWTFVAGVLLGIAVLFGFNGPHAAFAQADTTAPTISSIAITSDTGDDNSYRRRDALGVYSIGDSIQITVTFNEDVSVTGAPQLELAIGSSNRTAEYESTDGSAAVFSYTVAEGDSDPDGISVAANKLSLNGGSIKDAAGTDANLSHNALAAQDGHMVDGIRPTVSAISIFSGGAGYDDVFNIGDEMFANISFSEAVRIGGEPQLTLDFDGEAKTAEWIGDLFFDFSYLIQEGDLDTDGVAIGANALSLNGGTIKDAAGNDAVLTHDAVGAAPYIVVDGVRPTVSSIAITSDPGEDDTYGTGDKIEVTVTFSEKMIVPVVAGDCPDAPDYCMPQLELDIGGEARTAEYQNTKGAAVVFAYNVQAGDTDENGIAIRSNKLTLNGGRIEDAVGIGMGANLADVSHAAVAADTGHKVVGHSLPLTLSGITMTEHQENEDMSVATYWVSGSDAAITWSLSGDDSDDFSIDKNMWQNGVLRFTSPPNYENPTDADTDNLYRVTIQASDGTNVSTLQIVVLVRNVWLDADEVPVISGTVRVGETLTADTSRISVTFSLGPWYWWIRSDGTTDTEIEGATGASYTLTDADAGKTVKVRVNFYVKHSGNFGFVSLTSEATAMVAALGVEPNSLATGVPVIGGTAQVGETLTVDTSGIDDPDGISNATFSYQWIAGTTDISGATGSSYAPLVADLGKTIKVRVSFDDDRNNFETLTSAATGAVAASPYGAVIWSGTMTVGRLQPFGVSLFGFDAPNAGTSLDFGDLEPSAFSYAGNSYIIETIAHFSDSGELEFGLDVPLVSGDFNLNLDGTPFLVRSDENTSLYAFSNHGLSWTHGQKVAVRLAVNRTATGVPVIGGTAQVGETLTVDTSGIDDPDGLSNATFSYQWIAGTTDISGAMGSSYAPLVADVGKAIKVRVSFTDGGKFQETLTSEATATVTAAVTPLTAGFQDAPDKHEGTGEFTFRIAFSEPISISYVTLRDGSLDVTNGSATKAKRVNGQRDLWQITVKPDSDADVTVVLPITEGCGDQGAVCTRAGGNERRVLSNRSELTVLGPAAANSPATGAPTISGTAQVGETLTAETDGIEDDDGLSNAAYSYRWLADDVEIAGATNRNYTLAAADAGTTIKVQVSFRDDKNNPETLTGGPTAKVLANVPGAPEHLNVSLHDTGALDLYWEAPTSDGGSDVTGYKVQWKETAAGWDTPADVSETTVSGTTHTITGLTDGVEYTVRVIASNDVGDGPSSAEATGTPRETTPPELATATVDGTMLTLTYDEAPDEASEPSADAFSVTVAGVEHTVDGVSVAGDTVTLTLASAVTAEDTVTVSYTAPTDAAADRIQDQAGNAASSFSGQAATNETEEAAEPLIARLEDVPETHNGADDAFTFVIAFSEPISISYKTLRDDSLDVTNGSATKAKRVDGQSDRWGITVEPDSDADVTVVLPVTGDCTAQDAVCTRDGTKLSNRSELTVPGPAAANSPATGAPIISGTARVGETLTVDTSGIDDPDGMSGAVFSYQWLADGVDIVGATGDTYTLVEADLDKAVKARVIFNDDDHNEETLTSPATAAVAAETAVPDAPQSLNVSPDDTGTLDVSWEAPASDGGSAITGYKVQWKSGSEDYDGSAGSTRQAEITDPASRTHTITGLTDGVEYAVRVIAVNDVGDGPPSDEATGTPRETTPPELSTATVDGATLTLTYDEDLDEASEPSSDAFSATVGGTGRAVDGVSVSGSSVTLTLASAVTPEDTVTVSYTVPTDAAAPRIQDEAGNPAASFSDQDVENNTPPPANTPATGAPTISGTVQVGKTLTVETSAIADADGLDNVGYSYQWLANGADITGATSSSYTLVDADKGKTIQVKVSFRDDKNNPETLTSEATAAVAPRPNSPATGAPTISGTAQVGETLTVDTSGIDDADGMSGAVFSYQWLANGADVTGATSDTYTPVAADVDKAIKVRVTFRDDRNHQETLTSPATAAVTAAADDSSIWSATLTVGSSGSFHGYWKDLMGSLAPDGFNINGSDYTVTSLNRYGDLMFAFVLDQALPGDFTLQVGDTTFRSEEAEVTTSSSSYSYQWQNKIPDLSDGDIVAVSLTVSSGD